MSKENDDLLRKINKEMGGKDKDFSLLKMGSDREDVEAMTTGSIAIDKAIGIGGMPCGRIIEIYGPEACGKTTICLGMIAQAQRDGKKCVFLDMEHALTPDLAIGCGVDMDELLFAQPNYGEQCLGVAEKLIQSGKIDLLVIDSVAAMTPKAELDGEMEDQQMGAQARMMGKGIRKLVAAIDESNCVVVFINQIREKLGVMFGNPEVTPGGKALKFAASLRLMARRVSTISEGKDAIGNVINVTVVKNKVEMPGRKTQVDLYFGKGIDNTKDVVAIGVECGVIAKSGSHLSYGPLKSNGIAAFLADMKEADLFPEIDEKIREVMSSGTITTIEEEEAAAIIAAEAEKDDFDDDQS